jgi:hypothetical protein
MLEGTVRHHQAILMVKILLILRRAFDCLLDERCVFWMHPLENRFYGGCCGRPTTLRAAPAFYFNLPCAGAAEQVAWR